MKPQRIQLSRKKGFNLQSVSQLLNGLPAVNVSRPSKWGNPYRVGDCGCNGIPYTPQMAVKLFCHYTVPAEGLADLAKKELRGKNLACWCGLGQPCHADTLLQIANEPLRILHLHLKLPFFEAIRKGEKTHEFRLADTWLPKLKGKMFDVIYLYLGYPKREHSGHILKRKWKGYEARTIQHDLFGPHKVRVVAIDVTEPSEL